MARFAPLGLYDPPAVNRQLIIGMLTIVNSADCGPPRLGGLIKSTSNSADWESDCWVQPRKDWGSQTPLEPPPAEPIGPFEDNVRAQVKALYRHIADALEEDIAEAREGEGLSVNEAAIKACLVLVRRTVPFLTLASKLKLGAFLKDTGELSFVVQSLITDRRLDCLISQDGTSVRAFRLDERMQASSTDVDLNDQDMPQELAEWVTNRA